MMRSPHGWQGCKSEVVTLEVTVNEVSFLSTIQFVDEPVPTVNNLGAVPPDDPLASITLSSISLLTGLLTVHVRLLSLSPISVVITCPPFS